MSQIVFKLNEENNRFGLFDERSQKFFSNAYVRDPKLSDLAEIASAIIKKSPKNIYNLILNDYYDIDNGYVNVMIAKEYFKLNPDLFKRAKEMLKEVPEKGKKGPKSPLDSSSGKKRGRPKKSDSNGEKLTVRTSSTSDVSTDGQVKKSRGRPKGSLGIKKLAAITVTV